MNVQYNKHKRYDLQRTRVKNVIKLYAKMLLNGDIDWIKLKNVYSRQIKDEFAEFNIKKIIRQKRAQIMVTDELIKLYDSQGISTESVIKKEKTIYNRSVKKEDFTNAVKILNNWRSSLDMLPDKQTTTQTQEISYIELLEDKKPKELKPKNKQIENKKEENE